MSEIKTCIAPEIKTIALVGVGGTGSYLAQGLAKMIAGYRLNIRVQLIDPDTVEEKNIHRQNFMAYEIGSYKADALAFRLNQQYGLSFASSVGKGEDVMKQQRYYSTLLVTCVDKIAPRKALAKMGLPWLDLGNDLEFGQAIYGAISNERDCAKVVKGWEKTPTVAGLPSPALKVGLDILKDRKKAPSCADTPFAEQSCFVNELAAQAGLMILHQLLVKGVVDTPAIYFDTAKGRMTPAKITPSYFEL